MSGGLLIQLVVDGFRCALCLWIWLAFAGRSKRVITTSMVLSCEVVKILCAVVVVSFQGKVMELVRQWTLRDSLTCSALPAAIYALQNYLIQIAYQNLDFLSFTMLNQTKLLFTAFFMFILLRHKQSLPQMGALVLMVVAAVMLTIGQATPSAVSLTGLNNFRKGALSVPSFLAKVLLDTKALYTGVIPVLSASVLSGLASTLCQMAMQNKGRNTYLMTVEMSLAGSLVLLCSMLRSPDGDKIVKQGFFYAWEKTTMIPVVSNAFGGIMVGVVTKHVGGVKKGFAIVSALIVTGIGQVLIDGHLPSPYVWVSLPLVVGSTLIHTRYPYVKQVKTV
ncbi:hypothetical protein CBR_g39403 [Chara braunii]|uniref:Uncharacterized protein n=1 Tax=Chara braunii TaxID=69332 RepID=A0A388LRI3_CHABU|nr:hypothetical protein CBR_g39403 [Chara braunii]|eukprot:GBG84940.1 hypothetical protein CBR_g39403 [Chara braunii]